MTVSQHSYAAVLQGSPDLALAIKGGSISDDDSQVPKVQGQLRIGLPGATLLTALDPRTLKRIRLTCAALFPAGAPSQTRVYDLAFTDRDITVDANTGDLIVTVASDEAILQDYAQLADDVTPRTYETSLRAVVGYVLGKIGATLQASPAGDADVTRYWPITNLIPNPRLETNITSWAAGTGASALAQQVMSSPFPPVGTKALKFTAAAGDANAIPAAATTSYPVTPGRWYVFTCYEAASASRTARAAMQWWSSNGTVLSSQSFGPSGTTDSTAFRRFTVIAQAPAGASHVYPYINTQSNTGGESHFVTDAMLYEGDELVAYFDGASTLTGYTVAWANTAHGSTSTRTPTTPRDKASLTWRAGISGMQFLLDIVQAAGYRLVCDEARKWTLRPMTGYSTGAAALSIRTAINLVGSRDRISRKSGLYFDGMVIVYTWQDPITGQQMTATDAWATTGTPQLVKRLDVQAPYPGPGRAQNTVQRAASRGRELTVRAVSDWTALAEQPISVYLDNTPIQTGTVSRVEWSIDNDEMTVTTRSTDTPASAWELIPAGQSWASQPVGGSWVGETI